MIHVRLLRAKWSKMEKKMTRCTPKLVKNDRKMSTKNDQKMIKNGEKSDQMDTENDQKFDRRRNTITISQQNNIGFKI